MFKRTNCFLIIFGVGLVGALTIDNQLTVIKNDCYERLAIGQRVKPTDVYNTLELNTVPECQKECTNDQEKCKTFSFGIGVKGNASCELSVHVIKETVDLKPIGTLADADFDLYIKKLGCKLVIEQKPPTGVVISNDVQHDGAEEAAPDTYEVIVSKPTQATHDSYTQDYQNERPSDRPVDSYGADSRPFESHRPYGPSRPSPQRPDRPDSDYGTNGPYNSNRPSTRPDSGYGPDRDILQTTLISIRPDPNRPTYTGLGPAFGFYDPERPDKQRPGRPSNGYDDRPDDRPSRPSNGYDDRPDDRPSRPLNSYDDRPNVGRPQHGYDGPNNGHNDRPIRPTNGYDNRPSDDDRPNIHRPSRPLNGYDDRPNNGHDDRPTNGYDDRPNNEHNDRPMRPSNGYGEENDRPTRPINSFHDRPSNGYDDRPHNDQDDRPYGPENRPIRPSNGYNSDDRPTHGFEDRPSNEYDDRPMRPSTGYNIDRPMRPFDRPMRPYEDRPNGYEFGDRPVRPYEDSRPERPFRPRPIDRPSHMPNLNRPSSGYDADNPNFEDRPFEHRPSSQRPESGYDDPRPVTFKPYDTDRYDDRPVFMRPNGYSDNEGRPPFRPSSLNHPYNEKPYFRPGPNDYDPGPIKQRPGRPSERPEPGYNNEPAINRPNPDVGGYDRPRPDYDIHIIERPDNNRPEYNRPQIGSGNPRPNPGSNRPHLERPYDNTRPPIDKPGRPFDPNNPNIQENPDIKPVSEATYKGDANSHEPNKGTGADANKISAEDEKLLTKITHTIGPHGQSVTSIITQIPTCFRRSLAGKRVSRAMVRREMPCERVEECQLECSDEKRFVCEGFNYRLDPTGNGRGDCELLDLPLVRIDMRRDVYPDPDFDIYERDRNAAPGCLPMEPFDFRDRGRDRDRIRGGLHDYDRFDTIERRHDFVRPYPDRDMRDRDRDRRPGYLDDRRMADRREDGYFHDSYSNRNGYHHTDHRMSDRHYLPNYNQPRPYLPKPHYQPQPYLPKNDHKETYYHDRERDRNHWGFNRGNGWGSYGGSYGNFGRPDSFYGNTNRHEGSNNNRRNYYLPNKVGGSRDWGTYGGSYGNGGNQNWGMTKPSYGGGIPSPYESPQVPLHYNGYGSNAHNFLPNSGNYLPNSGSQTYIPTYGSHGASYGGSNNAFKPSPPYGSSGSAYGSPDYSHKGNVYPITITAIIPATGHQYNPNQIQENTFYSGSDDVMEHKKIGPQIKEGHVGYNFLKDECSLRTATGFRLHKIIVKKFYSVPNINECEMLCFKETDFQCLSYAFRYTLTSNLQADNCYLSSRSYKELDFYTDLEPDRDFDIYTMNNQKRCESPMTKVHDNSECFWHIRSGQRLDQKIVRDSMNVKNIVDCQLECLRSDKFLCRSFSFRYGSQIIGGAIDNCQLTDWPFMELDPRMQLMPEPGFEIYERGSFGHGCEPNHFSIRGKDHPTIGSNTDQLCYIGYGTPARLLPQATRKSIFVNSELDCKSECTKTRQETLFQCMSFSYRLKAQRGQTNCDLSDILQRDLLTNVDYVSDSDSWLFAWDNYNPECVAIADSSNNLIGSNYLGRDDNMDISRYDPGTALDTWRVYTVSGWPCRRGSLCKENREAGFWSCELEGGDQDTWDYCCHPDHQCGYSEGFNYQWCYVGPDRTQWRKCSDKYYPYMSNLIHRNEYNQNNKPEPYLPYEGDAPPFITGRPSGNGFTPFDPTNSRPSSFRPDRPQAPFKPPPRKPSLNEYEQQFNSQFLDPPKPGGFGQPRYWPVSYLHKEMPPNETSSYDYKPLDNKGYDRMKTSKNMDNRYAAIQNLIEIIKSNDINNIQYQINNASKSIMDDILVVKIPLPTNFTDDTQKSDKMKTITDDKLSRPIDLSNNQNSNTNNNNNKRPKNTNRIKDLSGNRGSGSTTSSNDRRTESDFTTQTNDGSDDQNTTTIRTNSNKSDRVNKQSNINRRTKQISDNDNDKEASNISERQVSAPLYRRSYITRTNVTNHGRNFGILDTES